MSAQTIANPLALLRVVTTGAIRALFTLVTSFAVGFDLISAMRSPGAVFATRRVLLVAFVTCIVIPAVVAILAIGDFPIAAPTGAVVVAEVRRIRVAVAIVAVPSVWIASQVASFVSIFDAIAAGTVAVFAAFMEGVVIVVLTAVVADFGGG